MIPQAKHAGTVIHAYLSPEGRLTRHFVRMLLTPGVQQADD
jgi:hypothetical protein